MTQQIFTYVIIAALAIGFIFVADWMAANIGLLGLD